MGNLQSRLVGALGEKTNFVIRLTLHPNAFDTFKRNVDFGIAGSPLEAANPNELFSKSDFFFDRLGNDQL